MTIKMKEANNAGGEIISVTKDVAGMVETHTGFYINEAQELQDAPPMTPMLSEFLKRMVFYVQPRQISGGLVCPVTSDELPPEWVREQIERMAKRSESEE